MMWYARAEGSMQCTKCNSDIPAGAACLSQLPWALPAGIHRSDYKNFCIACFEWDQGGSPVPCCTLAPEHLQREIVEDPVSCQRCRETMHPNTRAFFWTFFDWPESTSARSNPEARKLHRWGGAAPGFGGLGGRKGGWNRLESGTQRMFRTRGLGRGLGSRPPPEARRLYESIPKSSRNSNEDTLQFLKGRDASHIKPVSRYPGLAKKPRNIVWENSSRNRSRGARDMTKAERAAAWADTQRAGYKALGKSVARQAALAAALEFIVAGLENWFHWRRGRKTGKQAAKDMAKSTLTSLWTAAVWIAVIKVVGLIVPSLVLLVLYLAMGSLIVGLFMGAPLAIPLVILGAGLAVLTVLAVLAAARIGFLIVGAVKSYRRVARAASQDDGNSVTVNDGFPLNEFRVYCCARCILQEHICPRVGPDRLEWSTGLSPEPGG